MRGTLVAVRERALTQFHTERRHPAPRPIDPGLPLWRQVAGEVRWSFTPPALWLEGVGANVVLSGLFLLVSPLTLHRHGWVVLVGVYFATFVLADVTTTNVLGVDADRTRLSLAAGLPLHRILLVKNLVLLVIVGLPTLLATAVLTATTGTRTTGTHTATGTHASAAASHALMQRTGVTVADVALPILVWLGVGNIVSVLLAVRPRALGQRWAARRDRRTTLPWLTHLALPYGLYYFVRPIDGEQRAILGYHLGRSMTGDTRAAIHLGVGLSVWLLGTVIAVAVVRRRGLRVW
ncbi:hypothetical protein GPX89_18450 [Nocardia sp. ET3-3]|uniref:Uncharacterized protein n=1 Tax=Nocardia terrae TaxID=2675851 RepID=A0A7K1UY59_9NOCA|nr:hypothetical protein [Nocardia terrae]MVU79211.1 hypothetical protein [Nocardia terrae]